MCENRTTEYGSNAERRLAEGAKRNDGGMAHWAAVLGGVVITGLAFVSDAAGVDTSVRMLRENGSSMNLEEVTLQGVAHLSGASPRQLGGTCEGTRFVLQDETGSIEIAIRRLRRLSEPLKEGDRVKVVAQVVVFRNQAGAVLRTCVMAVDIEHLAQ